MQKKSNLEDLKPWSAKIRFQHNKANIKLWHRMILWTRRAITILYRKRRSIKGVNLSKYVDRK